FWCEIRITSNNACHQYFNQRDDTSGFNEVLFERILEDDRASKINDLDDTKFINHTVVQFQVSMRKSHLMQISHPSNNLFKATSNLLLCLSSCHHDCKLF